MNLQTKIEIAPSAWKIAYSDRIVMLGSCFSDNLARKMQEYYFQVVANPFGTLYNPVSIARHLHDKAVQTADVVTVTFGTAWVYADKKQCVPDWMEAVVDNCQKRPAADFERRRLTVDEIVRLWQPILAENTDRRFVFTVSPIRHIKDGLHENNVSKAILLQAVDELVRNAPCGSRAAYFPSYEIMLDELRDYRFYADDMKHPSTLAVQYIWERFVDTYFDADTRNEMQVLHQLFLDRNHRPLKPDSDDYRLFCQRTQAEYEELKKHYPWL